jgi:hypothetical protein
LKFWDEEGIGKLYLAQSRKGAKVLQIPLFPPLSKGDERGIGFVYVLGVLARKHFLSIQLGA